MCPETVPLPPSATTLIGMVSLSLVVVEVYQVVPGVVAVVDGEAEVVGQDVDAVVVVPVARRLQGVRPPSPVARRILQATS